MRHTRPRLDEARQLAIREMDRMGEHGSLTQRAGPVIDVEVVAGLGKQPRDLRDLARVLRHVALPPGPGRAGERGRLTQELGRAGDGEPRRHRVAQPPVRRTMPALDEVGGLVQRPMQNCRRLDRRVIGHPIHHHLAEDRPDAVDLGRAEGGVHRGFVDDPVREDRRRPGSREGAEDRRGEPFGDRGIGPRTLRREREPVEPGQEVQGEPDPRVRKLRQVGMRIDETGEDDPRPQVKSAGEEFR